MDIDAIIDTLNRAVTDIDVAVRDLVLDSETDANRRKADDIALRVEGVRQNLWCVMDRLRQFTHVKPMTDAERVELEALRADNRTRQLGDRPMAPAAKKLQRQLELERREILARSRDMALKRAAIGYPADHGRSNHRPR